MAILRLNDVMYSPGLEPLLEHVTLQINRGDRVALIGPNGSGKTTLTGLLTGTIAADHGDRHQLRGAQIASMAQMEAPRPGVSVRAYVDAGLALWSELRAAYEQALTSMTEAPEDEQAQRNYGEAESRFLLAGGHAFEARRDAALNRLNLGHLLDREACTLSGGERHRSQLARLLLTPADLWILDEPTNHLDEASIGWLIDLLGRASNAWLVISHDRQVLGGPVQTIWELDQHSVQVYRGPLELFHSDRAMRSETLHAEWKAYRTEREGLEAFVRKYKAGQKTKQASARQTRLDKLTPPPTPPTPNRPLRIRFDDVMRSGDQVLRTEGLVIGPGFDLLDVGDLLLRRGDRVALVGANGCGKSTLLRTLAETLPMRSGSITLGVKVLRGFGDQHLDLLDDDLQTVEWLQKNTDADGQRLLDLAGFFGFQGELRERPIAALSGGERVRLAMVHLLLSQHNLLILDEPTNHLDLPCRVGLEQALIAFPGTVLFTSHDRTFCDAVATRCWSIADGRLSEGAPQRPEPARKGPSERPASAGAQRHAERKARAAQQRKADKLAQQVENLQLEIEAAERALNEGDQGEDWEALSARQAAIEALRLSCAELEERWLSLATDLEA
jgi:ATP-binding cassette, subfamily F, member 3